MIRMNGLYIHPVDTERSCRQEMSSRDKDPTTPHQPLLSSLVVRPTDSGGGSDYEPGEVRRDPPPYSRSDGSHAEKRWLVQEPEVLSKPVILF
ncbi:hypothetical protein L1987_50102 [Smallanthus sonchifolius]|uniref:Uncharacterized protein n=1 Tax=Smallanthus sonchifolius TaxID=185202 RepID=A0ACB9FWF2_9ASTR|nr:hypothetical protein L1987_50102 [Smallanthus sonchifolius]